VPGPAGPAGLPYTYLRYHGGYDQPIELPAVAGTGASQWKVLNSVTIPEIAQGQYFGTAHLQVSGPYSSTIECILEGGFEGAMAAAFVDHQIVRLSSPDLPTNSPSIRLQTMLSMFDDWAPIQLTCRATGLGDDEVLRITDYQFALIRVGG
jgi:hypothetical protein